MQNAFDHKIVRRGGTSTRLIMKSIVVVSILKFNWYSPSQWDSHFVLRHFVSTVEETIVAISANEGN